MLAQAYDAAADNDRTSGSMAEAKESVAVSGQLPAFTRKRSRREPVAMIMRRAFIKWHPANTVLPSPSAVCLALYQLHVGQ